MRGGKGKKAVETGSSREVALEGERFFIFTPKQISAAIGRGRAQALQGLQMVDTCLLEP